ncbi:aminopeptidase N [Parafrankia sp. EUN1f]|uniref:aminopeptidase N n=1 Tax=Parafrankia sp. EUN1f TaxID=102897 RepID=UPI0001C459E3|nr:aminopeptidase N [Parafrankia sp. EUN1f]EFC84372.1 aminopeptidase N [Parafrankia sp. EUN1f]
MQPLSQAEAVARAELVQVRSYDVDLDLTGAPDGPRFTSTTTVSFTCRVPGASTFVDVKAVSLDLVRLNGRELGASPAPDGRLVLTDLDVENTLVVRATMACTNTGEGLHRFTDSEDGEVYLYAQSFLDDAARIFACFDQPDLKAPLRLAVSAPGGWEVRANGAGRQVAPGRWEFEPTAPLATYVVSLVAGPYRVWSRTHDEVPLALLCRRSLAPYLEAQAAEIFQITTECLDHYHELFGIRYPFGKYDQAFVPEFNMGAMENPGLVVFRDELVFRSAVTEAERERRAVVIAHEMAHMWFGDLVTMRWWDDLWLNESFAEYMGTRVTAAATGFTEAWTSFAVGRKSWGYAADQRPSTHPVAPPAVADTAAALLNFDGISYAKGASALRQLVEWVGDEAFLAGLRAYFTAHAYGSATLADLLAALEQASGRDLAGWAQAWLRRPRLDTLRPRVSLDEQGAYAAVEIVRTEPAGEPAARPHRVGIGVFDAPAQGGPVTLVRRATVDLEPTAPGGRTPVPQLLGTRPGRLLLVNEGDLTYAKIRFGPEDLARLGAVLADLADPLARSVVWSAAADLTRDAEWPAADYLTLAARALPTERSVAVLEDALGFAVGTVVHCYLPEGDRSAARRMVVDACRSVIDRAAGPAPAGASAGSAGSAGAGGGAGPGGAAGAGAGLVLAAARGLVSCAERPEVARLRGWLVGRDVPAGLVVDPDLRWRLLDRLVALDEAGEAQIAAELDNDPSSRGIEQAARIRAAVGDPAAKARAWRTVTADEAMSVRLVAATAQGFWQPDQGDLTDPYVERYFAELPRVAARRSPHAVRQVAAAAFPRYAVRPATLAAAESLLAGPDAGPVLSRVVMDAADDLRRAVAAREVHRRACPRGWPGVPADGAAASG